jgi:hypothetical protein
MAAVSSGRLSLNTIVATGNQFGGNSAAAPQGNPTLLQAISQGNGQNGTNGLNGNAAGGGTVNTSYGSVNTAPGKNEQSGQSGDAPMGKEDGDKFVTSPPNTEIGIGGFFPCPCAIYF